MTWDILTYGTGGPLMYAALGFALIAAVFGFTCWQWLKATAAAEIPLNYIAEERYRPAYKPVPGPTNFSQVFASSAYALTASVPYSPGAVWYVAEDNRTYRR